MHFPHYEDYSAKFSKNVSSLEFSKAHNKHIDKHSHW